MPPGYTCATATQHDFDLADLAKSVFYVVAG